MYDGQIFTVIKQPMRDGDKVVNFEIARRSPGVRLIIIKDNKLLITKEFRAELDIYDYRLPGGKVFNTLNEYNKHINNDIMPFAIEAAKLECKEEAGLQVKNIKHCTTNKSGATIVWDLIYFIIDDFKKISSGQIFEIGEDISITWQSFDEVKSLIKNGQFNEARSVGVLFKFFLQYPSGYMSNHI